MMRRITTTLAAVFLLPAVLGAQEWYIPKRTELLKKGAGEFGTKLQFTANNDGLLDTRRIEIIPHLRYTPLSRLEVYVEIPGGHAFQEEVVGSQIRETGAFGVGDFFNQVTYEAWSGADWRSLLHLDMVWPTGKNPYDNRAALGSGHFSFALGSSVMKVVDPAVLFAFLGVQQPLPRSFDSTGRVAPGTSVRFRIGTSIALNPRLRTSLSTSGESTTHTSLNRTNLAGSSGTTARMGWGLDWNVFKDYRLALDTVFGATKSTTDFVLILGGARRF